MPPTADDHNVLLYVEAAAAHTQSQKQNHPFTGRASCSHSASFLQELRNLHCSKCEKHPFSFDETVVNEILQNKSSFSPVKKMYFSTVSLFLFSVADKKRILTASAKVRAQCAVCTVEKHLYFDEAQAVWAPSMKSSRTCSTPRDSRRLRVRSITELRRLHLVLTSPPFPQRKRRRNFSYGHKIVTPVLESANQSVV